VVLKLDRLTRRVKVMCEIIDLFDKQGKALMSVRDSLDTSSASGRMMVNVMASFAQYERDLCSERTSAALQELKRQGVRLGAPPRDLPTATEFRIKHLRASTAMSLRAIATDVGESLAIVRRVLDLPR